MQTEKVMLRAKNLFKIFKACGEQEHVCKALLNIGIKIEINEAKVTEFTIEYFNSVDKYKQKYGLTERINFPKIIALTIYNFVSNWDYLEIFDLRQIDESQEVDLHKLQKILSFLFASIFFTLINFFYCNEQSVDKNDVRKQLISFFRADNINMLCKSYFYNIYAYNNKDSQFTFNSLTFQGLLLFTESVLLNTNLHDSKMMDDEELISADNKSAILEPKLNIDFDN